MDNVSESQRLIDSETQTEIRGTSTPLSSEILNENELTKFSLESDEPRRRKSNRREWNESYTNDRKILEEVVEEKPAFHEYTGLRLGSICALV